MNSHREKKMKNVTLEVVALKCGMSKSTVSRVLNNHTKNFSVLPEKREMIFKIANQLGYKPNLVASTLKKQRTKIVVIFGLAPYEGPSIYSSILIEVVEVLQRAGYNVCSIFPSGGKVGTVPPWKIDGAMVFYSVQIKSLEDIDSAHLPYVSINGEAGFNGTSFLVDEAKGGHYAMEHLYSLGHRRIVYRNSFYPGHYSVSARHQAFIFECQKLNLPLLSGHDIHQISAEEFLKNFVLSNKATAILAYSHSECLDIYFKAIRLGISIPSQLSIMCFNDVFPCAQLIPAITTIALPLRQMGVTAAKKLIEMMNSNSDKKLSDLYFSPKLIVRESTARINEK